MGNYKNCSRCAKYKCEYGTCPDGYVFVSENESSSLGPKYAICLDGRNETMKQWWLNNGNLAPDKTEELPCYQATDFDNALDKLIEP